MTKKEALMGEEDKKRGEGVFDIGLGGLFKGPGSLFELISRMAEEGKGEYSRTGEIKGLGEKVRGVYGFSVRMGLEGKPVVEQFGNIKATEKGAVVTEVREPIVDVFDEGERLVIIAELPGVAEENIHLEVRGDVLVLTAEARGRTYAKEILLPEMVDPDSLVSSYKNGILETQLAKRKR
jgi:HSP20 family protein